MRNHQAASLTEAVEIAEGLKRSGTCDWFRGQARNWPLQSTYSRRDEAGQRTAADKLAEFETWLAEIPELAAIAAEPDAMLAVAQHYGIPTTFVDFTTEPNVAAFFAAHDPPPDHDDEDVSCIICLDTEELAEFADVLRAARPDLPAPQQIVLDIPELWRIEAQRGVFLFYPFDEGFERHWFSFDRICFPVARTPDEMAALIPLRDIYPEQKSQLEVLLDQHFMLERMREGTAAMRASIGSLVTTIRAGSEADGVELECFGEAGLPMHESWAPTRLRDWIELSRERWTPLSEAPVLRVGRPRMDDPFEARESLAPELLDEITATPGCRRTPVRWEQTHPSDADETRAVSEAMSLLWDGLRRLPVSDADLASGLATAAVLARSVLAEPGARTDGQRAKAVATRCLGAAIEIEIGMGDGSYTRGYVNTRALEASVRGDFAVYLTEEWTAQIDSIYAILQIARVPARIFVFDAFARIFAREVAPTQVALRGTDTGKARLYNPANAAFVGLS